MRQSIQNALRLTGYQLRKIKPENDYELYKRYFSKDSIKNRAFYNISAGGHFGFGGGFSHPLWTNIDVSFEGQNPSINPEKDIHHDVLAMEPIPIESDSAELVLSRFTIEHITDKAAQCMFREVHRCLRSGGVFRIIAPNNELDYHAYNINDLSHFNWIQWQSDPQVMKKLAYAAPINRASIHQVFLAHFASNASTIHGDGADKPIADEEFAHIMSSLPFTDAMNYCTDRCSIEKQQKYRQNHINWWTYNKAEHFLKNAGFSVVCAVSPMQSISPVMRNNIYFHGLFEEVAFYIEAVK